MTALLTMAWKDLLLVWRDRMSLFWLFGLPLMFALFFGSIFGSSSGGKSNPIRVIAVTPESPGAVKFIDRLDQSSGLSVTRMDREAAELKVRSGKAVAFIDVRYAPSSGTLDPFAAIESQGAAGWLPEVLVGIDPARQAERGMLQGVLMESMFAGASDIVNQPGATAARARVALEQMKAQSDLPVATRLLLGGLFASTASLLEHLDREPVDSSGAAPTGVGSAIEFVSVVKRRAGPRNAFEITFPSAMMWGLLSCVFAFALTLVRERRDGTLLRLFAAPLPRSRVLLGKGLACLVACLAVIAVMFLVGTTCFGIVIDDYAKLLVATACTASCFVGLMMMMSVMGRSETAVSGAVWGINMVFAMLGGAMIPLVAMPSWMQTLSDVSPVKWGILSLEGAIWRGFTWSQMLAPCGILIAIGGTGYVIGSWVFSRQRI